MAKTSNKPVRYQGTFGSSSTDGHRFAKGGKVKKTTKKKTKKTV